MIAVALLLSAFAQPVCNLNGTQQELNACAHDDFDRADAVLNRAYASAIATARRGDADLDRRYDSRPGYEQVLREAQRAWITFRDAHCTYVGYQDARGGSMEPLSYDGCRARITEDRVRQLRGTVEER